MQSLHFLQICLELPTACNSRLSLALRLQQTHVANIYLKKNIFDVEKVNRWHISLQHSQSFWYNWTAINISSPRFYPRPACYKHVHSHICTRPTLTRSPTISHLHAHEDIQMHSLSLSPHPLTNGLGSGTKTEIGIIPLIHWISSSNGWVSILVPQVN